MRFRAVPVLTNTVPKGAQRGPGENQAANMFEPLLDKAAGELGIDRLAIRRRSMRRVKAAKDAKYGKDQGPVTSAYLKERWRRAQNDSTGRSARKRSGERNGSKVRGFGIGQAYHSAGSKRLRRAGPDHA